MPRLSPEQRAQLVEDYRAGIATGVIATRYGVSHTTLTSYLRMAGVTPRHPVNRVLSDDIENEIKCLYDAGVGLAEMAAQFGVSKNTVRTIARYRGASMRPTGTQRSLFVRDDAFAVDSDEALYWAGLLMADGWVRPEVNSFGISLSNEDGEHVNRFREFLGYTGKVTNRPARGCNSPCVSISVVSKPIIRDLVRFGIVARKSLTATAADTAIESRHFWRGVIDGDGTLAWYQIDGNRYPYIQLVGSRQMMDQFRSFCIAITKHDGPQVRPKANIWRFRLTGKAALPIIKTLYQHGDIALPRKADAAADILANFIGVRRPRSCWRRDRMSGIPQFVIS